MKFYKCLNQRQSYARTLRINFINLIKAREDVFYILTANALSRIFHREHQICICSSTGESYLSVLRCIFKGVRQQIEENALHLLYVDGEREVIGYIKINGKGNIMFTCTDVKRLSPFANQRSKSGFLQMKVELSVLVFTEVEYLINNALQYQNVFIGNAHKNILL